MFNNKERISIEEAEIMIKDLTDGYVSDGYDTDTARSMAVAYLKVEYEW